MTEHTHSDPAGIDKAMAQAMAAHLFGEADASQRQRLEIALARSPQHRRHWEELSGTFDHMASVALSEAPDDLESDLFERLRAAERAEHEETHVATIASVNGEVAVRSEGAKEWRTALGGEAVNPQDEVRVDPDARALVRLADQSELWVNANSVLRFLRREGRTAVRLIRGEVLAFMERQSKAFEILTQDGTVSVVGTVFDTEADPSEGTRVSVLEGRVRVASGAQQRVLRARQRARLFKHGRVQRLRRLSAKEVERLDHWRSALKSPMRSGGEKSLRKLRKEISMDTVKRVLFSLLGLALLLVGLGVWRQTQASADPGRDVERIREVVAEAERLELTEPVTLRLLPRPGDAWTQTTTISGPMTEDTIWAGEVNYELNLTLVSEAEAFAGARPGETVVEHRVTDVDAEIDVSAWPSHLRPIVRADLEEREASLLRSTVREVLTADGQRRALEIDIPNVPMPAAMGAEMLLWSLATPLGIPDEEPLAPGTRWEREESMMDLLDTPTITISTLDGLEIVGGERHAIVSSAGSLLLGPDADEGVELIAERDAEGGWTQVALRRLESTWRGEDRYRLSDGRRIMTSGHSDTQVEVHMLTVTPGGERNAGAIRAVQSLDITAVLEPRS